MISSLINDRFLSKYPWYNISLNFYSHYYTSGKKKNRDIVFREIINTVETKHISPQGVFCSGVYYTRDSTHKDCRNVLNKGRFALAPFPEFPHIQKFCLPTRPPWIVTAGGRHRKREGHVHDSYLMSFSRLLSLFLCTHASRLFRYWQYLKSICLSLFLFPHIPL
jgi:hypothetical protein